MRCYGRTETETFVQEWYETASRDAGKRARELRELGFRVAYSKMGSQITKVGTVRMTLLSAKCDQGQKIPEPENIITI